MWFKLIVTALIYLVLSSAQLASGSGIKYKALDPSSPVLYLNGVVSYQGKQFTLGKYCFFVDGQLSDEEASVSPFVFNSLNEALDKIHEGTEQVPMTLLIAPYVYWIDNPDDESVRRPVEGNVPFGKMVKTNWLTFYGLSPKPENVVIACNRGQTLGAEGNFTLFYFDGDGIRFENVTLGNYCNVDLEYPLKPALNRKKRSPTIVQAQLALCNSDKVVALNTRFISRLNSCPMVGAVRAYFENCYFECTDDALCGTGVYYQCRFTFFSSKPFYSTRGTGAVFLDSDIDVLTQGRQYFVKVGTPVTLVDVRFHHASDSLYIGWIQDAPNTLRCYSHNLTLNGKPISIQADKPEVNVSLTGSETLNAFKVERGGKLQYNLFNLLRGNDDWNPTEMEVLTPHLPTRIFCTPSAKVESGVSSTLLKAEVKRFYNVPSREEVFWKIDERDNHLLALDIQPDGSCKITGTNEFDETRSVIVTAHTTSGLVGATEVSVSPRFLEAPEFLSEPKLVFMNEELLLDYKLDLQGRADHSLITWYRCKPDGTHPIKVAVSRLNQPMKVYKLTPEDAGYSIMATIEPKHVRCYAGKPTQVLSPPITTERVKKREFINNFKNFPTDWQEEILPGFWSVDSYKPDDTQEFNWDILPGKPAWLYGEGTDNARGKLGLIQAEKGARLRYTPLEGNYNDMKIRLMVSPCKSAGQGFGSATGQYMDIGIKFDTRNLTGYALRIIRTTKYDNAVDFLLVKYESGKVHPISEPVSATCYLTECSIELNAVGNKFKAKVSTTAPQGPKNAHLPHEVSLEGEIEPNFFGGILIQHTGSVGASATLLNGLEVEIEVSEPGFSQDDDD